VLDLILAIAHHLLVFGMFGMLCAELVMVKRGIDLAVVARVARMDIGYGATATLIVAIGFSRAVFVAKGWHYYQHNGFFWAKIATFAVIGLLSAPPTMAFIRWRRANITPSEAQVDGVRRFLLAELALFALLLAFAAAMARGYGAF
jgi:putative membrane protein